MNVVDLATFIEPSPPSLFRAWASKFRLNGDDRYWGTVTLEEHPLTYTAIWKIVGDKLVVYFRGRTKLRFWDRLQANPKLSPECYSRN
jgi:hypothetical protein